MGGSFDTDRKETLAFSLAAVGQSGNGNGGNGDGGGSDSAANVEYVAGSVEAKVNGQRSGVRFSVENDGSDVAEIIGIAVHVPSGPAAMILETQTGKNSPDQHEVYIEGDDIGRLDMSGGEHYQENDNPLQLGVHENLNDTAIVQPGERVTVNTFQYRKHNGDVIWNMGGTEVTITLYFADGTSQEYTFTAVDPYR